MRSAHHSQIGRLGQTVRKRCGVVEIGVHNSTLAITIAISVLESTDIAVPAAVYGVVMFPVAAAFGWAITRTSGRDRSEARVG